MSEETTKPEEEKEELEGWEQNEKDGFIPLPEAPEEEVEEGEEASVEVEEKPEEIAGFKPTPIEGIERDEGLEEIVHLGQVHRITKDKLKELAQKGFDYDTKVGPHGKIARIIETNPEIAQMVEDAWLAKMQPKSMPIEVKPITDYDNEDDWLKDNMQSAINAFIKQTPAASPTQDNSVARTLMMRDPQHFQLVISKFPQYLNKVSVENYRRLDTDPAALCEFYDYVKEQEVDKKKPILPKPKPSFKVRSGGGVVPRQEDNAQHAWNLSNEEFDKQIARIKGYG